MAETTDIKKKESLIYGKEARHVANIERQLPASFADTLIFHMKRCKHTAESLAENSLVATKTIHRMRKELGYRAKFETIIAVCVGLDLHPVLSMDLIKKSGYTFQSCNQEHIIYQMLLYSKYKSTIHQWNKILNENGFKSLTREE